MTSTHSPLRVLVGALFVLTLMVAGSVRGAPAQGIIYVRHDAVGNNDGSSWADAYTDLQDALGTAQSGDEIWVAQGVYYPAPTAIDRTATFELVDGVALYGGFVGTENEREERDWEANVTVLSGDLDRNDITDNGVVTDTTNITGNNAYHVVTGDGVGVTTVLDGFTITAGQADGTVPHNRGGGIFNSDSSPTLTNVIFSGNQANEDGGGMYNWQSSPTLTNVTFSANQAYIEGGGMFNYDNSSPTLTNVTFSDNQAEWGGGISNWNSSSLTLNNVIFSGNQAYAGGGMYSLSPPVPYAPTNHPSVLITAPVSASCAFTVPRTVWPPMVVKSSSLPSCEAFGRNYASSGSDLTDTNRRTTLTDVDFIGNYAEHGGGMYNDGRYRDSNPMLFSVTFSGNQAKSGGGMYNSDSSPTLTNVIFSGNQANEDGGGMYNDGLYRQSSPVLVNATFSGNRANEDGGGIYNSDSSPMLVNSILWGNSPGSIVNTGGSIATITHSAVEGGYPGEGNIDTDPLFVDSVDASHAPTTAGDYHLVKGSPAIDAGTNDVLTVNTDLVGNPRIVDGTRDGNAIVDMGAYEYLEVLLTIVKEGQGLVSGASGLIDCGGLCTAGFLADTQFTLTASADPGWTFTGWSGDIISTDNPLELTIQANTAITASFTQDEYTLEVDIVGEGHVDIEPEQSSYVYGDVVTLTATTDPGWTFAEWTGDVDSTENPLALTIQGDTAITATFTQDEYSLDVTIVGEGDVGIEPEQSSYVYGDVVTLTATTRTGWVFCGWSGDVVSTESRLHLTMDSDKTLTATFERKTYLITPTEWPGGFITPNTPQTVQHGDDITFTIAAKPGYHIADVVVDGISQGAISSYTFINVTNDHSISAMFALNVPPHFVSADHTAFFVGTAETFTVEATGVPTPTIALTGVLPSGVTFTDNGDGTATLSGTPAVSSAGVYPLVFTASNNVAPDATQSFTLTVKTKVYLPLVLTNQ